MLQKTFTNTFVRVKLYHGEKNMGTCSYWNSLGYLLTMSRKELDIMKKQIRFLKLIIVILLAIIILLVI